VNVLGVLLHPQRTLVALAAAPRLRHGAVCVIASGIVSQGLGVAASAAAGGGARGLGVALSLPVLFVAYWALEGWLVDAAAAMLGGGGRRRTFLAVAGYTYPAWIAYAILSLAEALALRFAGRGGPDLASALAWSTPVVLAWFVLLTALAIRAVYRVPPLNALAFALLPYAAILTAVLVLGLALGALHAARLI
jgi:hypothetical protein